MNRGGQEAWTLIARTMRSSSFARICIEGDIDMARLEAMRRAGPDGENRRVSGHDVVCGAGRHISVLARSNILVPVSTMVLAVALLCGEWRNCSPVCEEPSRMEG
jgi:hypothetical protein